MKNWLHKIEVVVDKLVFFMLILLLAIIVLDLGFPKIAEEYHIYILLGDYLVITVFVLDLIFKYIRTRSIPKFLKKYWIDILAVFPFFLVFRALEGVAGLFSASLSEGVATTQKVLHEGLEIEKEGSKVARELEEVGKLSRSEKFARFLRPILRMPRFLKATPFFEKPTGDHHPYEPKAVKALGNEIRKESRKLKKKIGKTYRKL